MEAPPAPPSIPENPQIPPPVSKTLQSIEDFMKEQESLDALKKPSTPEARSPPRNKARKTVDIEALSLEAAAVASLGEVNWIGRLAEYRAAHPTTQTEEGLSYIEKPVEGSTSRFTCTCSIVESPSPFPTDPTVSFTRKKEAKQHASKSAIDWLITQNFMPADGTIKFPKNPSPPRQTHRILSTKEKKASPLSQDKSQNFAES